METYDEVLAGFGYRLRRLDVRAGKGRLVLATFTDQNGRNHTIRGQAPNYEEAVEDAILNMVRKLQGDPDLPF